MTASSMLNFTVVARLTVVPLGRPRLLGGEAVSAVSGFLSVGAIVKAMGGYLQQSKTNALIGAQMATIMTTMVHIQVHLAGSLVR